jgi:isopentenyldiphosphate isomerase
MDKTISVWLILTDGENHNKVVLQKRSSKEKNYPSICQATWAGKIEDNESVESAIERECREELGVELYKNFDFSGLKFFSKNNFYFKEKEWTCYNYVGEITQKILDLAKIHSDAMPEFVFAGKENIDNLILFKDQYEVLKNIYDTKGNK